MSRATRWMGSGSVPGGQGAREKRQSAQKESNRPPIAEKGRRGSPAAEAAAARLVKAVSGKETLAPVASLRASARAGHLFMWSCRTTQAATSFRRLVPLPRCRRDERAGPREG